MFSFIHETQGHTRAIYQHQLLQAIDRENSQVETQMADNNEKLRELSVDVDDAIVTRSGRIIYRHWIFFQGQKLFDIVLYFLDGIFEK